MIESSDATQNPDPSLEQLTIDFTGDEPIVRMEAWTNAANKLRFKLTVTSPLGRFSVVNTADLILRMSARLNPPTEKTESVPQEAPLQQRLLKILQNNPKKWFDALELCSLTDASRTQVNKVLRAFKDNHLVEYKPGGYGRGSRSSYRLNNPANNRTDTVSKAEGTVLPQAGESVDFDEI
jgi:hypothetical protein